MKASIIIGTNAYAVIKYETGSMDILLKPGRSAAQSLREYAIECREKAERLQRKADLALEASEIFRAQDAAKRAA